MTLSLSPLAALALARPRWPLAGWRALLAPAPSLAQHHPAGALLLADGQPPGDALPPTDHFPAVATTTGQPLDTGLHDLGHPTPF